MPATTESSCRSSSEDDGGMPRVPKPLDSCGVSSDTDPSATATTGADRMRTRPQGTSDRNIRIEGLNPALDAAELRQMFECFGPVVSHKLMVDMRTGQSRGVAFVQFETAADAASAVATMDGFIMDDKPLMVQFARVSTRAPSEATSKVVLRYLPSDTPEPEILRLIHSHVPQPVTVKQVEYFPDTVPQLALVMVTLASPAEAQLCVDHVNRKEQLMPNRDDAAAHNLSKRLCMPISVKLLDDALAASLLSEKSAGSPVPTGRGGRQQSQHPRRGGHAAAQHHYLNGALHPPPQFYNLPQRGFGGPQARQAQPMYPQPPPSYQQQFNPIFAVAPSGPMNQVFALPPGGQFITALPFPGQLQLQPQQQQQQQHGLGSQPIVLYQLSGGTPAQGAGTFVMIEAASAPTAPAPVGEPQQQIYFASSFPRE